MFNRSSYKVSPLRSSTRIAMGTEHYEYGPAHVPLYEEQTLGPVSQDVMSRHRCQTAVIWLSGGISLLSRRTASGERWPFLQTPDHYDRFVSARLVSLTVKRAYAIALYERFLTVLSLPSHASVTIWEATAPVKLPTIQCLDADGSNRLDTKKNKRVFH